jgi:hypothetical protein
MREQGVRLSEMSWKPGSEAQYRKALLARMDRRRGDEAHRSARGFGYMRRKNEAPDNVSSLRDGWYYDTASFGAGAAFAKTIFFALPQGGAKFLNSTNLTGQGGQVPAGETLQVRSIRLYISNTTVPADFQNLINNVSVEFRVRNYPIYQCTPEFFPPGFGAATLCAAQLGTAPAGTATVTSTSNGMPQQTAVYDLKVPYQLNSQESFSVILNPETAFNMTAAAAVNPLGVGTTIRIYLEGARQALVGG